MVSCGVLEHAIQRDPRPLGDFFVNRNLIDDRPRHKIFERPAQVRQVNPIHRRTHADDGRQEMDFLLGMLVLQPLNQV